MRFSNSPLNSLGCLVGWQQAKKESYEQRMKDDQLKKDKEATRKADEADRKKKEEDKRKRDEEKRLEKENQKRDELRQSPDKWTPHV